MDNDFFSFEKPLFPALARPLFILALVCNVLYSAYWIWTGLDRRFPGNYFILIGLAYLFLGPLVLRVIFEALLSLFRIEGHLAALRDRRGEPGAAAGPALAPPPAAPFTQS